MYDVVKTESDVADFMIRLNLDVKSGDHDIRATIIQVVMPRLITAYASGTADAPPNSAAYFRLLCVAGALATADPPSRPLLAEQGLIPILMGHIEDFVRYRNSPAEQRYQGSPDPVTSDFQKDSFSSAVLCYMLELLDDVEPEASMEEKGERDNLLQRRCLVDVDTQSQLLDACVAVIKVPTPPIPLSVHPLLCIFAKLTRNHSHARAFFRNGGLSALLTLRLNPDDDGDYPAPGVNPPVGVLHDIFRHVVEEPSVLQAAMQQEIYSVLTEVSRQVEQKNLPLETVMMYPMLWVSDTVSY